MREFSALSDRWKDAKDWLDYRAALVCSVMANMWRDPKKTKFISPDEFMPKKPNIKQSAEQMLANVKLLNSAYGGNVIES